MKIPQIFLFSGLSETGKTRMITSLIPKLLADGYKVGVTKSRPHKFDIDKEGKDSWKYNEAGANGILLYSPEQITLFCPSVKTNLRNLTIQYFSDYDIVLAEGFSKEDNVNKIAFLRKGVSENLQLPLSNLIAVISDFPYTANVPVFHPDEIDEVYDLIKSMIHVERYRQFKLLVNGKPLGVNHFIKAFMQNVIMSMVNSLKVKDTIVQEISITITDPEEEEEPLHIPEKTP